MRKAKLFMDTVVDIQVIADAAEDLVETKIDRAFEAFRKVEQACSRFSPDSELMAACRRIRTPVPVSPFLFEPLKFAIEMAEFTDGLFDPAVGKTMEEHGFNRHYLTGEHVHSQAAADATYRDIALDEHNRTLVLKKPLVIDLGAVAKGFAIDLAAHELKEFPGFIVNAGGDLFAGGTDEDGRPWKIGIRHPVHKDRIIEMIEISDKAVCTSGSYERRSPISDGLHHIVHPATMRSPNEWVSCSVVAPFAMMADAFSTVAFLSDSESVRPLLEQTELQALLIAPDLQVSRIGGI